MQYKSFTYDGTKAISVEDLPREAWDFIMGGEPKDGDIQKLYKTVPWLFRGVGHLSNAVDSGS